MNAAPALPSVKPAGPGRTMRPPSVRAPGLGWLPAVWRRAALWRTVGRFVVLGPLIGGAPYAVFVFPIPFAYLIGVLPALIAGMLFATWVHGSPAGRAPSWPWRLIVGTLCGAAPALLAVVPFVLLAERPDMFMPTVIAMHGVPAAAVLALMHRAPTCNSTASKAGG